MTTAAAEPVSGLAAATLDLLPQSVYIVDRNLTVVAWNAPREQGPLGLARVRALGRHLRDVLSRRGFHSVLPALGHVLETGTPFEEERTTSDGLRTYRIRRVPVSSNGVVTHIVTIAEDVTIPSALSTARVLAAARLALAGVIPVCAWCKKIRDQRGDWHQVEAYLATRSDASFTHGICADCAGRVHLSRPGAWRGCWILAPRQVAPELLQPAVTAASGAVGVVPDRALLVEVLVVVLGRVEGARGLDCRQDRPLERLRPLDLRAWIPRPAAAARRRGRRCPCGTGGRCRRTGDRRWWDRRCARRPRAAAR